MRFAKFILMLLLPVPGVSACAQSTPANSSGAAGPVPGAQPTVPGNAGGPTSSQTTTQAGGVTQTGTAPGQSSPGTTSAPNADTITGVPKYNAGYGPRNAAPAPVATKAVTITGKGDHTGTGGTVARDTLPLPQLKNSLGVQSGTPIHVRLTRAINSGAAKNGDMVDGVLTAPVGSAHAGSPVRLTVVAAAAAGTLTSAGEISIQVISINGENILSNVITAEGHEGETVLPDDAPPRGTEASFSPDVTLTLPAA